MPVDAPWWLRTLKDRVLCSRSDRFDDIDPQSALAEDRWAQVIQVLTASAEHHALGLYLKGDTQQLAQEALHSQSPAAVYWFGLHCAGPQSLISPAHIEDCRAFDSEQQWHVARLGRFDIALRGLGASDDMADVQRWLERLAQTSQPVAPSQTIPAVVLSHASMTWRPSEISTVLMRAYGVTHGLTMPAYSPLTRVCNPDAAPEGSMRRQLCLQVAEHMVSGQGTLLDVTMGARLGELLGWPIERVRRLHLEMNAGTAAQIQAMPSTSSAKGSDHGCGMLLQLRDHTLLSSLYGEHKAVGFWRQRSGKSLDQWALELRPYQPRPWQAPTSASAPGATVGR